jgi:hypothetical protein
MITVPVVLGFDDRRKIGTLTIDEDALPETPDFVFALGYLSKDARLDANGRVVTTSYDLICVSVQPDEAYAAFLANEKTRPVLDAVAVIG